MIHNLLFWGGIWAILGGMIPSAIIANQVMTHSKLSIPKRIVFAFCAGPSFWIVIFFAAIVACFFLIVNVAKVYRAHEKSKT